jgi:hypothetical protein
MAALFFTTSAATLRCVNAYLMGFVEHTGEVWLQEFTARLALTRGLELRRQWRGELECP